MKPKTDLTDIVLSVTVLFKKVVALSKYDHVNFVLISPWTACETSTKVEISLSWDIYIYICVDKKREFL